MDFSDFLVLRDEISLIALMLVLMLYDLFAPERMRKAMPAIACVLFLVQIGITLIPSTTAEVFGGMYQNSAITSLAKTIMSLGTMLVFLLSNKWIQEQHPIAVGEYYFLTLSTLLGMYFMVSAGHFLMYFIGIELASIPLACLISFNKRETGSAEAGAKFILNAAFASGISVFGISLLYGATGTLYFADMPVALCGTPLQIAGMILFSVGLFFKMSLVPFHSWTADVYQGGPTMVSAYLSVVSKAAAAITLFGIFVRVFGSMSDSWAPVIYTVIILSITIANLFALRQKNIKRFLAFSSISQAGYIVLGLLAASPEGIAGMLYYVFVYMFANIAAFGVAHLVEQRCGNSEIASFNGLYKTNPKLSVLMMLALFSLAGIPPFAGFFSKFFIFAAAVKEGYYILVLIALLNTVISLYYYLMVVKAMFINPNDHPVAAFRSDLSSRIALFLCLAGIVLSGLVSFFYNKTEEMAERTCNYSQNISTAPAADTTLMPMEEIFAPDINGSEKIPEPVR